VRGHLLRGSSANPHRSALALFGGVWPQRKLKPRACYPTISVVYLHSSPLARLASIFGFRR
jgi:hypothetical protein